MDWIREKRNRAAAALLTGMLAAALLTGTPRGSSEQSVLAWWGTLYPAFCFQDGEEFPKDTDSEENAGLKKEEEAGDGKEPEVKLSFWLAKALKRW